MTNLKLLLLAVDLILIHTVHTSNVHYITPSPSNRCPGEPCLTLSTLVANSSEYLDSNTSWIFLEGSHILDSDLIVNGTLQMLSAFGSGAAAIICSANANLNFFHVSQLQISGLEFIRCSIKVELVDWFTLEDSRFYGSNDSSALHLNHTNTSIVQSSFISNTAGTYQSQIAILAYVKDNRNEFPFRSRPNIVSTSGSVGGALFVTSSIVDIHGSWFVSNTAVVGGAIFSQSESKIKVNNCTFVNNSATGCSDDGCHGGALFIDSGCTVSAHNCAFMNNVAGYSGGAIVLFQETLLNITHSEFCGNRANKLGGAISGYSKSRISIDNGFCSSNTVGEFGGAIYVHTYSSVTMGNSSFDKNIADFYGGVLYASSSSSVTVGYSFFNRNKAGDDGGVMYVWDSSGIIVGNSSFIHNIAGCYAGGAMYASSSSSITIGDSFFDKNEAGTSGGALYADSRSSITVGNSFFHNNVAEDNGGVMFVDLTNVAVDNCIFDHNEAGYYGGVLSARISTKVTMKNSSFDNNVACDGGGVLHATTNSRITVDNCSFGNNTANRDGGVVYVYSSTTNIIFEKCTLLNNSALEGGVVYVRNAYFADQGSTYCGNMANNGGVITVNEGNIEVKASRFVNNTAENSGGVLYTPFYHHKHVIKLETCYFTNNNANSGGVIAALLNATVIVTESTFTQNNAISGGAIYINIGNSLTAKDSYFFHNCAYGDGGVIYSENRNKLNLETCELNFNRAENNGGVIYLLLQNEFNITGENNNFIGNLAHSGGVAYAIKSTTNIHTKTLLMDNNTATETGGAIYLSAADIIIFGGNTTLTYNQAHSGGALYASESSTVYGYSGTLLMASNTARESGGAVYLSKANLSFVGGNNTFTENRANIAGGAIHLNEGLLTFSDGYNKLVRNKADDGGAIFLSKSKLLIERKSHVKIDANLASHHGGGLYLTKSELKIKGKSSYITRNKAQSNGGGIHATNSSIIIEETVFITSNKAKNGGGVSLETNARLHGMSARNGQTINSVLNRASHYGGAIYVDDETNPDMCAAINVQSIKPSTECFSKSVFINVLNNYANVSGSNLFGGLLDRCTIHNVSKIGIISFLNSSNINKSRLDTISSHPIQVCFCRDSQPDCNYRPEPIKINREKTFSIELIAYDQVHHAVNASIRCSLNSSAGGLGEGQQIQDINKACTKLEYNLFTPSNYEELIFSAVRDPCNDISEISIKTVMIDIICSCPIGFQTSPSCDCNCHQVLQSYEKTECNPTTESIIRRENFWISYINHTRSNSSGYVVYQHCPFDYCYPPDQQVSINLNLPNGSDAQCAHNRIGTLCGICKPGLSVSLGSSKCVPCPIYWPGLLTTVIIVFIISGIGLVAFLLALNLTVAIGTLNAVIFYANIVAANKSALFPSGVSPASVFISWLNFDIGFDICFFDGMDTYIKTWLQLAFPAYIIILVVVIIQLSYHFNGFGRLVGKKDPVATLATLILLSYTKLLQIIITAFSSATLDYPDGSKKTLWLPDATVKYFSAKQAPLLLIATVILVAGLIYTFILLSWQWFLCCPRNRIKWIRNQKFSSFIEIYLIPYTPKHRYWTGLLLLIRVSVYLVSAFNPNDDPRVTLLATNFIMTSLVIYIATFGVRMYKNCYINTMETLTYFNITALATFTWYSIDSNTNQTAVTNISVGITFIQLIAVIVYHVCKHANQKLSGLIQHNVVCSRMNEILTLKQKRSNHKMTHVDEEIRQSHELLDTIDRPTNTNNTGISSTSQVQPKSTAPTQSVIELPKPQVAPIASPPREATMEMLELESEQQASEHDGIDNVKMIPVGLENPSTEIKNKQCYSEIEITDCEDTSTNPRTEVERSAILKRNSIPKPHSSTQINTNSQATEEAIETCTPNQSDLDKIRRSETTAGY